METTFAHHAPLQMVQTLSLLPFIPAPQLPHPHFMYGPVTHQLQSDHAPSTAVPWPHPLMQDWSGMTSDIPVQQPYLQPAWTGGGHVTRPGGHVTEDSAAGFEKEGGAETSAPLPSIAGAGPAQGFYSFLNDQALNSDLSSYQLSSSSNIWTPPSASQSQGEELGEWPSSGLNQWPHQWLEVTD